MLFFSILRPIFIHCIHNTISKVNRLYNLYFLDDMTDRCNCYLSTKYSQLNIVLYIPEQIVTLFKKFCNFESLSLSKQARMVTDLLFCTCHLNICYSIHVKQLNFVIKMAVRWKSRNCMNCWWVYSYLQRSSTYRAFNKRHPKHPLIHTEL